MSALGHQLEHLLVGLAMFAAGYFTRRLDWYHSHVRTQRRVESPTLPRDIRPR